MKPDSVIVLFMECDTECEFYKALIDFLRKVNGGRLSSFIECQVLKGVGNFCTKAERILQKDLMNRPKYRNITEHIKVQRPERTSESICHERTQICKKA